MKKLLLILIIPLAFTVSVNAQTKKDSLKIKADIDAISDGKNVNSTTKKSILNVDDSLPVKVDSMATKSGSPIPTPPTSNNPNPHEPAPVGVPPTPAPPKTQVDKE